MKKIVVTFLFLILVSCGAQEAIHLNAIEFTSQTRGDRLQVMIIQDEITINDNGVEKKCVLKAQTWKKIEASISGDQIKRASEFSSENDDQKVDRAKISSIRFITSEGNYETANFDDFNAPKEFEVLMKEIQSKLESECTMK